MGGGGGGTTAAPQDPAVGEAAKMNAETAKEQLDWTKQYFADVMSPLQKQSQADTHAAELRAEDQYAIDKAQLQQATDRYKTYGIPAEDRYYRMVDQYSAPEEEERQARTAIADVTNADAVANGDLRRRLAASGIDPTSPAAVSAMSDASIMTAASKAQAANRARDAARSLGMAMTSDAANFGRGTTSNIATFSQLASGSNAQTGALASQNLSNASGTGTFMQSGYRNASAAYGQNLASLTADADSRLRAGTANAQANAAGAGAAIGGIASIAGAAAIAI